MPDVIHPLSRIDPTYPLAQGLLLCPVLVRQSGFQGMPVWDAAQQRYTQVFYNNKGGPIWTRALSVSGKAAYDGREGELCLQGDAGGSVEMIVRMIPDFDGTPISYSFWCVHSPTNSTSGLTRICDTDRSGPFAVYVNASAGTWGAFPRNAANSATLTTTNFTVGDWIDGIQVFAANAYVAFKSGVSSATFNTCDVAKSWLQGSTQPVNMNIVPISYSIGGTGTTRVSPYQGQIAAYGLWKNRIITAAEAVYHTAHWREMFIPPPRPYWALGGIVRTPNVDGLSMGGVRFPDPLGG